MKRENRSLEELTKAGFVEIPRTFPRLMFQTDGERTMIYSFEGENTFRKMYDGANKYVRGLIDKK